MNKLLARHSLIAGSGAIFIICLLAFFVVGCKNDTTPSLFDPNVQGRPSPTISGVTPPNSGLAGVTVLTITGTNFSSVKEEDLVYFDGAPGEVQEASANQLKVKPPIVVKDSIKIKVAVLGAELYSNAVLYRLDAASAEFGGFTSFDEPWAVTCDATGNLYVSLITRGAGVGVKKLTAAGVVSDYSPVFSSQINRWTGMKFGPGGYLYAVTTRNIIFRMNPGGGSASIWLMGGGLGTLYDLDFDAQGNIWTGGSGTAIYEVKQDKTVKSFPFTGDIRSIRVYSGALYVAAKIDTTWKIMRFPIAGDNLGTGEEYFNFTSSSFGSGGSGAYAITLNTDGDMYVGTDALAALVVVHPNKTAESLYPGVISPQAMFLAWGDGPNLYATRRGISVPNAVLKINTLKTGAPYYGRQ